MNYNTYIAQYITNLRQSDEISDISDEISEGYLVKFVHIKLQ